MRDHICVYKHIDKFNIDGCGWSPATKAYKDPNFPNSTFSYQTFHPVGSLNSCCPNGQILENYQSGKIKWNNYPPTLFTETYNDVDSDPHGQVIYVNMLKQKLGPSGSKKIAALHRYMDSNRCMIYDPQSKKICSQLKY